MNLICSSYVKIVLKTLHKTACKKRKLYIFHESNGRLYELLDLCTTIIKSSVRICDLEIVFWYGLADFNADSKKKVLKFSAPRNRNNEI